MESNMISETMPIEIHETPASRLAEMESGEMLFGKHFSDHMFIADYDGKEWTELRIIPFENISMSPGTAVLHYGQSIFEGMKAFKTETGDINLFRHKDNINRFNQSATRMCMPEIPEKIFEEALIQLIRLDKGWVPSGENTSLYIRPFMISTSEYIGVRASETYRFMIITSPAGKYYTVPVRVKIETEFIRAADGGTGSVKCAGNYGGSLYPAKLAQQKGYHQLLWTDAKEHKYIEESGTMNIMFVINGTIVTPALSSTILGGITRDSVLTIAHDKGLNIEERRISVEELIEAANNGTLQEAFGVGTAATIAHIETIGYNGKDYDLPPIEQCKISPKIASHLRNIRRSKEADPHGWTYTI